MIEVRRADGRPETVEDGRSTRHSFSFGAHYDPGNVGFSSLVAHNDERLPPGTGYADHPHADTEVVSWVVEGALRHTSTVGSGVPTVLGPGSVQRLSAGSGVVHSEVADGGLPTRFVQAWVRPDEPGTVPSYDAAHDVVANLDHGWTQLAGAGGLLGIGTAGARLYVGSTAAGGRLALPEAPAVHVFVVGSGSVLLGERRLDDGDAARLVEESGRTVCAADDSVPAHLLAWAFDRR